MSYQFKCVSRVSFIHFIAGPPYDLQTREVRSDSAVLLWKPPVYQGRDPVNGFYIDVRETEAPEEAWRGVNTKATEKTFFKVSTLSKHLFKTFVHLADTMSYFNYRLKTWRKARPMCSEFAHRITPVLEKPQKSLSQSQLSPNQASQIDF